MVMEEKQFEFIDLGMADESKMNELLNFIWNNRPDPYALNMLLWEAWHQGLSATEAVDYLMAAWEELVLMNESQGIGPGLEWANARREMHNEWVLIKRSHIANAPLCDDAKEII